MDVDAAIERLEARLKAHRVAFSAMAIVLDERLPGFMDALSMCVGTFEAGFRQQNEHDAAIAELRLLRRDLDGLRH